MKRFGISVAVLCLAAAIAPSQAATSSCFSPDEAKAAQFRILQQEFNVAALNCQTVDPNDPTFSSRYNAFVGKFGAKLQENAQVLRTHFSRAGGSFDVWMTKVANDAGQRVITDANYCQTAWENLEKSLDIEPADVDTFAVSAGSAHSYMQSCDAVKSAPTKEKKTKKTKEAKHPAKTASAQ